MPPERNRNAEQLLAKAMERSRVTRDELSVAAVDLFLPPDRRLTDQQRAIMYDLLAKLLTGIEFEIRQYLAEGLLQLSGRQTDLGTELSDERVRIAMSAIESGQFGDPGLVELLLRRTEEHLIALRSAASEPAAPSSVGVVEALARNPDAELARRAVAYVVAQSKRRDRFQEPLLSRDELPADLAYRLHWQVAALLRQHLLRTHIVEPVELDRTIEDATRRAMADHSEGQGLARRAVRLVARLNELGELGDGFLEQALAQGHASLFAAGLAVRAEIAIDVVWRVLLDRGRNSLLVLARAIGVREDAVASIVDMLDGVHPLVRSPAATQSLLAAYTDLEPAGALRVVRSWQLDPGYRDAIDDLDR